MALTLEHDVSLTSLNTLGLPAVAARLARCTSVADVQEAVRLAARESWPVLVLGGGSNIVFGRDPPGLVLLMALRGIVADDGGGQAWRVRAAAGENWHDFVMDTVGRGWGGLENLALIPGTVGAAPVQNIGAYGVEQDQMFEELVAVDLRDASLVRFDRAACGFGYRASRFKGADAGRHAIVEVAYRLPSGRKPNTAYAELRRELDARGIADPDAGDVADAVIAIRRAKLPDPAVLGNAGSFFKNPLVDAAQLARLRAQWPDIVAYPQDDGRHKLAAGWLIDRAGWKGRAVGDAAVYERQALVLVNRGRARAADIAALAAAIQADVRARYGVELEPEPVWV